MKFRLLLSLCMLAVTCLAQENKGLITKSTEPATIANSETHRYTVSLDKDQFTILQVKQIKGDILVKTLDPKGDQIELFDGPYPSEHVTITSTTPGDYFIEVTSLEEPGDEAEYSIELIDQRKAAKDDAGKVDEIFSRWDKRDSPGASVAVLHDGKIVLSKGYGMANLEYDIPITPSTIFHIASVSKQFTVFSVLLLEADGKLSMEDDIRKYIPEMPDFGKTITLRHLASHTSGLRDQWNLLAMAGWRLDDVITTDQVLRLISKQKELNFEPGERYLYCNTGFTLLAEVVARVSGKSFPEYTDEEIFKPLGMTNTLFYDDHQRIVKNRAYSYYSVDDGYKKSVLSYAIAGATSLFTTVEDLSLWADNFRTMKIGNEDIFSQMNTPYALNNGETFGGGLGQFIGEYKGLKEIQHGGADAGYRSYLTRFPDQNTAIAVFSNDASFNSGEMAHKVADLYLKDFIKQDEAEEARDETTEEQVALDPELLKNYIGDFEMNAGFILKMSQQDDQLFFQIDGGKTRLIPSGPNEFRIQGADVVFTFSNMVNNVMDSVHVTAGAEKFFGKRMAPFNASEVDLSQYTGKFYSEELETFYIFKEEEGKLMAHHSRHDPFELKAVKKDNFSGDAWWFSQVEFVKNDAGIVTGCRVSNGRVLNLWFEKE